MRNIQPGFTQNYKLTKTRPNISSRFLSYSLIMPMTRITTTRKTWTDMFSCRYLIQYDGSHRRIITWPLMVDQGSWITFDSHKRVVHSTSRITYTVTIIDHVRPRTNHDIHDHTGKTRSWKRPLSLRRLTTMQLYLTAWGFTRFGGKHRCDPPQFWPIKAHLKRLLKA